MSKGYEMGHGYEEIQDFNGGLTVEIFGVNSESRIERALEVFSKYRNHPVPRLWVATLGVDKHDPMVEKFFYVGVK